MEAGRPSREDRLDRQPCAGWSCSSLLTARFSPSPSRFNGLADGPDTIRISGPPFYAAQHLAQAVFILRWALIAGTVLNAFYEELVYMGYGFNLWAAKYGPRTAVLFSILARLSIHTYQGAEHLLPIAVWAVIFGVWYRLSPERLAPDRGAPDDRPDFIWAAQNLGTRAGLKFLLCAAGGSTLKVKCDGTGVYASRPDCGA